MRTVAMIVAAGGQPGAPSLLAPLAGRPIVEHSIDAFTAAPEVDEVVLVAPPELARGLPAGRVTLIAGTAGARAASVGRAVEALGGTECHLLIHDAARPLISPQVITDCAAALGSADAVCAAVPASDTMVTVEKDIIDKRPERSRLRRREYPQGFRLPVIRRGYELALADPGFRPTDDCGVLLRYLPGVPVRLVPGSGQGFPVTSPLDLDIAEAILQTQLR